MYGMNLTVPLKTKDGRNGETVLLHKPKKEYTDQAEASRN